MATTAAVSPIPTLGTIVYRDGIPTAGGWGEIILQIHPDPGVIAAHAAGAGMVGHRLTIHQILVGHKAPHLGTLSGRRTRQAA